MSESPRAPSAWQVLQDHHRTAAAFNLRDLLAADAGRFEKFSVRCGDILFDFSKHLATEETLRALVALARERALPEWTERMFRGERINATENRAALHTALRSREPLVLDGRDVRAEVESARAVVHRFCAEVRSGTRRSSSGRVFSDVVNIGIGGSDLGPAFVSEALAHCAGPRPRLHFVSNVDGAHLAGVIAGLTPETTLFIVSSKTFATQETLANAGSARDWLAQALGEQQAGRHFAAVTSNLAAARDYGIAADAVFEVRDWVGGRYSVWSAVGLPIALAVGMERFEEFLGGAREMDEHFRRTPLERNAPVLAGLLGVWYINFFGAGAHAILPYDQRLRRLPEYLQQLEMESNGKRVTRDGNPVATATAPVVFGAAGTNAQHAFCQLLHQGTQLVPADFIACCRSPHELPGHHAILLANFFAQTEALAVGRSAAEVEEQMRAERREPSRRARLLPHRVFPGNRPTTSILLSELDARSLGALIAFYEHKTFVQSVIWNVNAFDQWGVELGKQLADRLLPELEGGAQVASHDVSTNGLINHYRRHRKR